MEILDTSPDKKETKSAPLVLEGLLEELLDAYADTDKFKKHSHIKDGIVEDDLEILDLSEKNEYGYRIIRKILNESEFNTFSNEISPLSVNLITADRPDEIIHFSLYAAYVEKVRLKRETDRNKSDFGSYTINENSEIVSSEEVGQLIEALAKYLPVAEKEDAA